MSAQASTVFGERLWQVVVWGLGRSGRSRWWPPAGDGVAMRAITEELCCHSFSASAISAINQRLDDGLAQFADRSLVEATT
jgi:hypothetical protein